MAMRSSGPGGPSSATAIGEVHAQKKAEARFWRDRGRGRNRDHRGRHDDRADSA